MAVRKTESRIPQIPGFSIDDLGQNAASGTNALVKIVSYLSSPLGVNILQNYVVFVEDPALRPNVASYEWTFNNNGTVTTSNTTNGVASFTPTAVGALSVTVNLKDSANTTLHAVVLQQQVAARNLELEQLIDQEGSSSPSAGNPNVSRDVINGLRIYADAAASPTTDNALNRLILSITYSNLLANNATLRNTLLENCSAALETNPDTFFTTAQNGIGVTKLRPHLAAMFIMDGATPLIAVTERPAGAGAAQIAATLTTIRTNFNGLAVRRDDIFNLLRFPKSNIKVCKLVLDGLKNRYFRTETFPVVLGNRTKARRLISEYGVGPYALPASGTADLIPASTAIFNNALMAVWRVSVSAATNPSDTIDPQTRLFGTPEFIPEKTYMADTGMFPGDAPFITAGRAYHQNFNINFTTIVSLQEIIDDLQANSTFFNHFRIFTHANENVLGLSLFRGGSGFVVSEHLDGFDTSELEGVRGVLSVYFSGGYLFGDDVADDFLNFLKSRSNPALGPFHLDTASATLSDDLRELFRRYIDIWLVNIPGTIRAVTGTAPPRNLSTPERSDFISFLNVIIRLVRASITTSIAGLTNAHFTALQNAILAVTNANLGLAAGVLPYSWQPIPNNLYPDNRFENLMKDLRSTAAALPAGNTFMTKLAHVRNNRFNASSVIDIRGCLAGRLPSTSIAPPPPFLLSVQSFFGRAGALPTVTAPEWFQSFNANYNVHRLANNAAVTNLFSSGFTGSPSLSPQEVLDSFDTWSRLSNLDDQFAFFVSLFPATPDLIDFARLRWRTWRARGSTNGIPPLHLYSSRVDDMVQLPLGDLLNRLRENFSAAGANLSGPVTTKLNALQPKIEDFKRIQDRFTPFSGADFTSFYTDLSALATQLVGIPGMPAPGTPLVDATIPAPLNRAHITGYIGNITTYLTSSLNTDIGPVFANIRTAIGAADAKRHYYFNIRLPLRVQTVSGVFVNYLVFYIDGAASDAVKSYMKCQWTGTPSQIADMDAFINGLSITDVNGSGFLETAILVESETSATPNAVAPLPEYRSHIIST